MKDQIKRHKDRIEPKEVTDVENGGTLRMKIYDWLLLDKTDWAALIQISRCSVSEQMISRWTRPQSPLVKCHTGRGIHYVCKQQTDDTHSIIP
jgi:hypothetical protein